MRILAITGGHSFDRAAFADLLDRLILTPGRNCKLALLKAYFRETPDPDRGWALAALTDGLDFPAVKSSTIRTMLMERIDPVLWTLSRDFVGDTAETASLLWPAPAEHPSPPRRRSGLLAVDDQSVDQQDDDRHDHADPGDQPGERPQPLVDLRNVQDPGVGGRPELVLLLALSWSCQ